MEDTIYIWKTVCENEFKNVESPDEDENWRDLYYVIINNFLVQNFRSVG
jgi:hypothetical protein